MCAWLSLSAYQPFTWRYTAGWPEVSASFSFLTRALNLPASSGFVSPTTAASFRLGPRTIARSTSGPSAGLMSRL